MAARWKVRKLPLWHWVIAGVAGALIIAGFSTWALDSWEMKHR